VFNTHWHADHVLGNEKFADATIVSTAHTRELIATIGAERLKSRIEALEEELPAEIESACAPLATRRARRCWSGRHPSSGQSGTGFPARRSRRSATSGARGR
jgi:metal-dependent hydrolase (beta-lactamase superfamily II)